MEMIYYFFNHLNFYQMKNKIFIGTAMSLFAVVTVINMNISQQNRSGDISLESIAIMARAQNENEENGVETKIEYDETHTSEYTFTTEEGEKVCTSTIRQWGVSCEGTGNVSCSPVSNESETIDCD
jgi:purine-nucleoside phosphorylase